MKRFLGFFILLIVVIVLAQDDSSSTEPGTEEKRIIRIDFSGGTEEGNFRFGPLSYTHPDAEGIVSTVSNLTIYSHQAELRGPEGEEIPLVDAEGGVLLLSTMALELHATDSRPKAPTFFTVKKQV